MDYYICPDCSNRALAKVYEDDTIYVCDECGSEFSGEDTYSGGIKFNKRYTFDKEFTPAADSVVQASSQLYPLVCDQSGIPFVYVPWTDTKYTLTQANANNLGGIKIGYTTSDRNFAVQLDPNGKAYVTVPASAEYQLPTATEDTLGGIKAKQSD